MPLQQIPNGADGAEDIIEECFETLDWSAVFGKRHPACSGLTWAFYGGRFAGTSVADGAVTLTNAAVNYVVASRSTFAVSTSTSTTNWDNTADFFRLYRLTTAGNLVTAIEDHRAGLFGPFGMTFPARRVVQTSAAITFTIVDQALHHVHPASDTTARVWTIPANASVPYPIGTQLTGANVNGAGALTLAITSDTLRLAGTASTGSRTIAANGRYWAEKVGTTEWQVWGYGIT